jgi:hypothetical protein
MQCKKVMGEKEPLEDKCETHGICPSCLKEIEKDDTSLNEGVLRWQKIVDRRKMI